MSTHCQICEREIKTVEARSGGGLRTPSRRRALIAHHGYKRPGQGWQTASCFGARYRPYEVACDAIPLAITGIRQWRDAQQSMFDKLMTEPPPGLEWDAGRPYWGQSKPAMAIRPAGFDPQTAKAVCYSPCEGIPYGNLFLARKRELEFNIKSAVQDIARLQKRFDEWRASS